MRLDQYLVQNGHAKSRQRATDLIRSGVVFLNNKKAKKPSLPVEEGDEVTLTQEDHPYVARSGLKLKALLKKQRIDVKDKVILDLGSSTGGFTQVALEFDAARVYAVDVGTDQMDAELKKDKRITLMENMDARKVGPEDLADDPTILTADLSFISLSTVLKEVLPKFKNLQTLCLLIKPQFELGPKFVGKGGIVRNERYREDARKQVQRTVEQEGFVVQFYMESPTKGGEGNQEYLMHAEKQA